MWALADTHFDAFSYFIRTVYLGQSACEAAHCNSVTAAIGNKRLVIHLT
jgi:hypothetical protein